MGPNEHVNFRAMKNEIPLVVLRHFKKLELENAALRAVLKSIRYPSQETPLHLSGIVRRILGEQSFQHTLREQYAALEKTLADIADHDTASVTLVRHLYERRFR